ncbi:serine hydrolase [Candidatus Beckwithbacteria bacterium]|nr:serine hydrolase [Candidatus Beckwithbacteria bacterium]
MKKKLFNLFTVIASLICGITIGWFLKAKLQPNPNAQTPLRSNSGYQLTHPLLACDSSFDADAESLKPLKKDVEDIVAQAKNNEKIFDISVYFRYLNNGEDFNINPEGKFFPASLKKLPLMMQYYRESETDPTILTTKRPFYSQIDNNAQTTIIPKASPINGQEYTAEQLIEYMIKYSDNNSFNVLYPALGENKFDKIYKDMQLHYPNSFTAREDYVTTYDVSLFFRALYNSTYLEPENSEKALKLLTETDYKQGLVRYLPQDLPVAHKFGIGVINDENNNPVGELHDCGIIYKQNNPYFLCVMTKSESKDLSQVENTIAEISRYIYQQVINK